MSSKYINSRMTYQEDGIDYQDNDFIALLQTHLQNALLEIDALKAQVNYLRDVLLDERKRYHVAKDLDEALEATPEHCLAEVKAKAIEDSMLKIINACVKYSVEKYINTSVEMVSVGQLKHLSEIRHHGEWEQAK